MLNRPFIRKKKRGFAFWSLVTALILFLLRLTPGIGQHIHLSPWIALVVGIVASLPGLFRWVRWHLLWKLRNRLFVTYALIGLTPVVLFGLLAAFAAYVLFGQFANFAATSEIHSELVSLAANTDALALHMQHELAEQKAPKGAADGLQLSQAVPPEAKNIMNIPGLEVGVYLDGKLQKLDLPSAHAITTVSTPPAWVARQFQRINFERPPGIFRRSHARTCWHPHPICDYRVAAGSSISRPGGQRIRHDGAVAERSSADQSSDR